MAARANPTSPTFGFLTVVEDADHGLLGGYLGLNAAGRPLEFHCTAPVKSSRAQEILYGPTLAPYLEGELIGGALVSRVKVAPVVVFTDRRAALAVRRACEVPAIWVMSAGEQETKDVSLPAPRTMEALRTDRSAASAAPQHGSTLTRFALGNHHLAALSDFSADRQVIEQTCRDALADFDLLEPFARIREALQEARSATAAPKPSRQVSAA